MITITGMKIGEDKVFAEKVVMSIIGLDGIEEYTRDDTEHCFVYFYVNGKVSCKMYYNENRIVIYEDR